MFLICQCHVTKGGIVVVYHWVMVNIHYTFMISLSLYQNVKVSWFEWSFFQSYYYYWKDECEVALISCKSTSAVYSHGPMMAGSQRVSKVLKGAMFHQLSHWNKM